jgi:hypothetical protein
MVMKAGDRSARPGELLLGDLLDLGQAVESERDREGFELIIGQSARFDVTDFRPCHPGQSVLGEVVDDVGPSPVIEAAASLVVEHGQDPPVDALTVAPATARPGILLRGHPGAASLSVRMFPSTGHPRTQSGVQKS